MVSPDLSRLCRIVGHEFSDLTLLEQALRHRSVSRRNNNERLEFLGDACLGIIIAQWLYQQFPSATEGQLTRMRAALVKGQTLARLGKALGVGDYLQLGPGELKSGGHRRDSIIADAMEAILGAVLLDAGMESAKAMVLSLWQDELAAISPEVADKDPKTLLQEFLQAQQRPLPVYEIVDVEGQAPKQVFKVHCRLDSGEYFAAQGGSRRKAEQAAARLALAAQENT